MARIRSIKPAFFSSDDTCRCSPLARLLFIGLWTEADREGRLEDRPDQLKRRLLPDDQVGVDALLWELVDRGLIRRYVSGGLGIVQVVHFLEHQKPHPKEAPSALPATGADLPRLNTASREQVVIHPIETPAVEISAPAASEPHLNTASREQVSVHPVEHPSSPRRNGSGSGDLGYGVSDQGQEGGGVPRRAPGLVVSPMEFHRQHGRHVSGFCDWLCLPQLVHDEFVNRVIGAGAQEPDAQAQVLAWAREVRRRWAGRIPGDDIFTFWRHEWQATHGSNKPGTAGGVDLLGGLNEVIARG